MTQALSVRMCIFVRSCSDAGARGTFRIASFYNFAECRNALEVHAAHEQTCTVGKNSKWTLIIFLDAWINLPSYRTGSSLSPSFCTFLSCTWFKTFRFGPGGATASPSSTHSIHCCRETCHCSCHWCRCFGRRMIPIEADPRWIRWRYWINFAGDCPKRQLRENHFGPPSNWSLNKNFDLVAQLPYYDDQKSVSGTLFQLLISEAIERVGRSVSLVQPVSLVPLE